MGQAGILIGELESPAFDVHADNAESLFHHVPVGRKIAKHTLKALDHSRLHKAVQRAQEVKQPARAAPSFSSTDADRFILLISLEHEEWFNYTPLVRAIKEKLAVSHAFKANDAIDKLASPSLAGVIVTDASLAKRTSSSVLKKLVEYVKAGGTAVIGFQFSNFIAGDSFEQFFKAFGLPWQRGSYHRTTHYLKKTNHIAAANPSLAPSYSMKALHADSVSNDQILYGPTRDSVTQSMVFQSRRVEKFTEAPIVIGKVGGGYVGYIGDVNAEKESTKAYLAMLNILDPAPGDVKVSAPSPSASTSTAKQATTPKLPSSKAGAASTSKAAVSTIHTPKATLPPSTMPSAQPSTSGPVRGVSKDAPLVVAHLGEQTSTKFMKTFGKQFEQLERKTKVEVVTQRSILEKRLSSGSIRGVYIADGGILSHENSSVLLPLLASYVKAGGTVLAGGLFPISMNIPNSKAFFSAFGLTWEMGWYGRAVYEVVATSELGKKNPELADVYGMKAVHLKGINLDVPVYIRLPDEDDTDEDSERANDPFDAPAVRARVGKGSVGYIGDVNGEDDTASVVLAMFGLIHPDTPAPPPKRKSRPFALLFTFSNEYETKRACKGFLEGLDGDLEVVFGNLSPERMTDLIGSPDLKAIIVNSTEVMAPDEAYLLSRIVSYVRDGGTVIFLNGFAQDITAPECRPFFMDNFGVDWVIHAGHYHVSQEDIVLNDKNLLVRSKARELPQEPEFGGMTLATSNPADVVYMPKKVPLPNVWDSSKGLYVGPCLYAAVGEKGKVGYTCEADYSSGELYMIMRAIITKIGPGRYLEVHLIFWTETAAKYQITNSDYRARTVVDKIIQRLCRLAEVQRSLRLTLRRPQARNLLIIRRP